MGRLTILEVREIRTMREGGFSYNQIAPRFNLVGETVRNICLGYTYKRVDRDWPLRTSYNSGRYSEEYSIWTAMKRRCYNPEDKYYKYYGGRGITVCDSWRKSFVEFMMDMGPRTPERPTLDRIDGNLGYYKENCRWATWEEQRTNRRKK